MAYDKARWGWEGGYILWTHIETSKLPLASSKWQSIDNFFSSMFTTIFSDSYNGDEEGHNQAGEE
jgi:hypothetical protein